MIKELLSIARSILFDWKLVFEYDDTPISTTPVGHIVEGLKGVWWIGMMILAKLMAISILPITVLFIFGTIPRGNKP